MILVCRTARMPLLFFVLCFTVWFWSDSLTPAYSQSATAEEIGLKIAQEARSLETGFGNFTAQQVMILRNKQGQQSKRQVRVKVLEVAEDSDKSLFVFDEPQDVKGTAFLIHAHRESADDQWLYLPAL